MKINFGMVVLNAEEFLKQSIDSIYEFANKIIIVEGSANDSPTGKCLVSNADGLSTDRTHSIISSYHDPEEKIIYKRAGNVSSKEDLCNMWLKYCDKYKCDYIWQIDSDELYEKWVLEDVKSFLVKNKDVVKIAFKPWCFYKNIDTVGSGTMFEEDFIRVFKFEKGFEWVSHTPPKLRWAGETRLVSECGTVLTGEDTKKKWWHLFHYSHMTYKQVKEKMMFHSYRGYYRPNWVNRIWENLNSTLIQKKYGIHPFDESRMHNRTSKSRLVKFMRKQPEAIMSHRMFSIQPKRKSFDILHISDSWSAGGGCKSPYVVSKKMNEMYGDTHEFAAFRMGVDPMFAGSSAFTINDDHKEIVEYIKKKKFDLVQFEWWNQGIKKFNYIAGRIEIPTLMNMHIYPIGGEWDLKASDLVYDAVAVTSSKMLTLGQFRGSGQQKNGLVRHINSPCDTDVYLNLKKNIHSGVNVVISTTLNDGKFRKNTFDIIDDIVKSHGDIIVHFIGVTPDSGMYVDTIRERYTDSNRVHFVGYVDTAEYLPKMDIALVILPENSYATSECFLQECMCLGMSTIKIGGKGSHVVTPNNVGGFIAKDEKEFFDYFQSIYLEKDLREKIRKEAREVIKSGYTTEDSAIKMREFYEELIDG